MKLRVIYMNELEFGNFFVTEKSIFLYRRKSD